MKSRVRSIVVSILLVTAAAAAHTLHADTSAGTSEVEVYAGIYMPEPDAFDNRPTGGLRLGYNVTDWFNVAASIGFANFNNRIREAPIGAGIKQTVLLLDISAAWQILPDARWVTLVYAGPGWAFGRLKIDTNDPFLQDQIEEAIGDDSFTVHAGVGGKIDFGRAGAYVRFNGLGRWFSEREEDEVDLEATLGIGWSFGG